MAEQSPRQTPKKKKSNPLARLILFLLVLAVAAGAIAAVVFRDSLNLDSIRRWFHYRSLLRSDSGQAESFLYDGGPNDAFAILDEDLLVCSGNAISLYSGSGTRYISQSVSMEKPVVNTSGALAVVYDAGGSSLYVLGQRALLWSADELDPILSARLNRSGQLTVVTQASGYRTAVTVYNASYTPVMSVNLAHSFAMDAALSDDGHTLAILTAEQQDGTFATVLSFYSMNYADGTYAPDVTCSLGGGVALDIKHTPSALWALEDQGLVIASQAGTTLPVNWGSLYLRRYTLGGDGFAAVLLGRYRSGSQAELWVINDKGERVSLTMSEQVLSIAAAGRYIAVLTGDRLDIYTDKLELYSSLEGTRGARNVLLMDNGAAVLISADSAGYYIP